MTRTPLVSIAVLSYNTGDLVIDALECLRRQTYTHFEVVLVDDDSSDGSVAAIQAWASRTRFPIVFLENQTNLGIAASLNRAIRGSSGEYVTWISDDLWDPSRLGTVIDCFESFPQTVGVVFGDAILVDEAGDEVGALSPARTVEVLDISSIAAMVPAEGGGAVIPGEVMHEALFSRCFIPAPTATVRRRLYEEIGYYDESLAIEDLDFWLRASKATSFGYLRAPLVRYRQHPRGFSTGRSGAYLAALSTTLERHGGAYPRRRRLAVKRHIREESFRVATNLFAAGLVRPALGTLRAHYLPNLEASGRCLKETGRLVGRAARAGALSRWTRYSATEPPHQRPAEAADR